MGAIDLGKLTNEEIAMAFAVVWGVLEFVEDNSPPNQPLRDARALVKWMCKDLAKQEGIEIAEVRVSVSPDILAC